MADDLGPDDPDQQQPTGDNEGDGRDAASSADERGAAETAAATPTGRRRRRRKAGRLKVALLTLLSLLLIVVLVAVGFGLYLNHMLGSNVRRYALLPTDKAGPTRQVSAGNAQNILLLGSDSRDPSNMRDNGRSDVIQLVHISDDYKSIQVIHFPRDLYVSIPGHGKNKINAAYAFGGTPLLVTTLQNLLDVHIDHVAQIGFTGFAKVTDELGGVDVYVAQAFDEKGYGHFTQGYHHMNGDQALGFVRERHQLKEGDIDRGRDQQAWIKAVLNKTLKAGTLLNPIKLTNILDDITRWTVVDNDMTTAYMRNTALKLRNIRGNDVTFFTAPFTGFGYNKVAGDIDIVDTAGMKELGHALATDTMDTYKGTQNTIR